MTPAETGGLPRLAGFDGLDLAYLDEGQGPLVVLLHGFGSDHRENWVDTGVVAALVARGRRVVAPDARGHGGSGKPHDPTAYGDDALARDARALLDHLGVSEPRSVAVVGYSMGSVTASRWVPGDERVGRLVLGGVGDHIADGSSSAMKGVFTRALSTDDPDSLPHPQLRAMRQWAEQRGNDLAALIALDTAGQADPTPEHLAGMGVPVLVLAGEGDWFVGSPAALAARIPGATARTVPGDHTTAAADPAFPAAIVDFICEDTA